MADNELLVLIDGQISSFNGPSTVLPAMEQSLIIVLVNLAPLNAVSKPAVAPFEVPVANCCPGSI